jgi:hypothetical protein
MDEIMEEHAPAPVVAPPEESDEDKDKRHEALLQLAKERFKQAFEATQDDFNECNTVQDFVAGKQWPEAIKNSRESDGRPCLTLDHLNQYIRHVVNTGLKQARDVRVTAMSGEADDKVADVIAGLIRQITQCSTAKVAYETGLRHECQYGFGYWRAKVQPVPKTPLNEITIRKIKDARMVLMDPFRDYPDGRDAKYCFVMTKFTKAEFDEQYGSSTDIQSWHGVDSTVTLPWIGEGAIVVCEYYFLDKEGIMRWAIICPNKVIDEGVHHGDVMPIICSVGEEYEHDGKERRRGMINNSSMDAQRAYNYSASAFVEAVALAPLAPFVAAQGQIEQHKAVWADAHRIPRAVLPYDPVHVSGQLVPPPQRSQPAGIPSGWDGMMKNLISDQQMIMGLAQPSVLGTGGAPVQSGAGITAQQEPGEVNTFHYHEHWHTAIEQTGRVIMAMIPSVYTEPQVVKIIGEDGKLGTAQLNPQQDQATVKLQGALDKALSTSYNPRIGRYDVVITTGPASASKKEAAAKGLTSLVTAFPALMEVAADLVVASLDIPGADVLAKRIKSMLPPGTTDEPTGQMMLLQKAIAENEELKTQLADMEKIVMADKVKSAADMEQERMKAMAKEQQLRIQNHADLFQQHLDDSVQIQMATIKSKTSLEVATQDNIVKVIIAQLTARNKIDVAVIAAFNKAAQEPTHESRMSGYLDVMGSLAGGGGMEPVGESGQLPPSPQPSIDTTI